LLGGFLNTKPPPPPPGPAGSVVVVGIVPSRYPYFDIG
jgi:hypothetical protein